MALLILQPGLQSAGQFDLKNGEIISGGEIGVFETIGLLNGYQVVKIRKATSGDVPPFFLLDDGNKGYGTNFGVTVSKTSTGFIDGSDGGTRIGPATYAASNKITLWDKPGLYAVTLDSLADNEATLKAAAPGTGLTIDSDGKLLLGNASSSPVAYAIQFKIDETLVTTSGSVINNKKLIIVFNPFGVI